MTEKILIIGKGFLGENIFSASLLHNIESIAASRSEKIFVDITDITSIEKVVLKYKPDFIINSAALTQIDEIELNPTQAFLVNAEGAKNVAQVANKNKTKFIQISTDSIFDGSKGMYDENSIPNPLNEYAKSKKLGEDLIMENSDKFIIVRTNFYGFHKGNKFLFNWVLQNLLDKKEFIAFDDVVFNPLEVRNLSELLIELLHVNFSGIINLSSNEVLSKYQFALKIARLLELDTNLIIKGSLNQSKLVAKRPLNTSLSNLKAKKILKTDFLNLDDWLKTNIRT